MIPESKQYPKKMLPSIDYDELENSGLLSSNIVDLEYGIMNHLHQFVEELTDILKQEKMIQAAPELMIAHICSYLGFLAATSINPKKSLELIPHIQGLIESEARSL